MQKIRALCLPIILLFFHRTTLSGYFCKFNLHELKGGENQTNFTNDVKNLSPEVIP